MNRTDATGLQIAPVYARLTGFLIDVAILVLVNLAVAAIIGDTKGENRETLGIVMLTTALYHIGFLIMRSATPGKIAMGAYVADKSGARLTPDKAILRYLVIIAGNLAIISPILFFVAAGIFLSNVVLIFVDPQRRTLHDRIAGTLVLSGKPPT